MGANDSVDIDQPGLDFISRWEGTILRVYRDIAGKLTVGVGHLVKASEVRDYPYGMSITRDQALALLHDDSQECVRALRAGITAPVNQSQADALISFAFNCGPGVLKNSGVARAVNEGRFSDVPAALREWSKCKINGVTQTNQGLLNRRISEARLFSAVVEQEAITFSPEEMAYINAQLDVSAKDLVCYANLACSDHPDDAEALMSMELATT